MLLFLALVWVVLALCGWSLCAIAGDADDRANLSQESERSESHSSLVKVASWS